VSSRREALIARYRVISIERLRSIRARMDAVSAGNAEALAEVKRELHTLKGDSHLLGLVRIGEVAHACEERLQDPSQLATAGAALTRALDVVKAALYDETADRTVFDGALRTAIVELGEHRGAATPPAPLAERPERPAPPQHARPPELADHPEHIDHIERIERAARPMPAPALPAPALVVAPPAAPPPEPPVSRIPVEQSEARRWIHVNAHDVDSVCERLSALHADLGRIHASLRGLLSGARDTLHDIERLRADLDETVSSAWALRLAPVYPALAELGDHAAELAVVQGKQLRVKIDDGGALIERRLLDEMREPLLHLVRNAVDHGIERPQDRAGKPVPAELVLAAEGRGDHVVITVADDGRGIDLASVRAVAISRGLADPSVPLSEEAAHELLFVHGFSTRTGATTLSGRGVGLDAVRRRLLSVGGRVTVARNPGGGTRFAIFVPSTIFRERVLIADVGGALCALPARDVEAIVPVASSMMESVGSTPLLRYQGEGIPFLPLPLYRGASDSTRAAIVSHGGRRWAISLPEVVGDVEMLRVPVDAAVASLGPFAASGTLDDGRLVLVVSLDAMLSRPRQIADLARTAVRERSRRRVLVVDDSPIVRDLLAELLSSVGLSVRVASDGAQALASLAEQAVDLIVCDVEMPVMDGFELLRRLRDRADRIPIVMVTTRGSLSDRATAAALGADALIVKSEFENAHLLETVRRFVEIGA
jgi:two-component system chemotaxis sensor kinase CheA